MKQKLLNVFILLSAMVLLSPAMAGQATTRLREALSHFSTYQANFSQVTIDNMGKVIQRGRGSVMIMKPGRLRWQVDKPTQQIIITDGTTLWIYNVLLAQVTQQSLAKTININPAAVLTGNLGGLTNKFVVKERQENQKTIFILMPKQSAANGFKSLRLDFVKQRLVQMVVTNNLDQVSFFSFSHIKINKPISAEQFHLKVPAGVDVIRQ